MDFVLSQFCREIGHAALPDKIPGWSVVPLHCRFYAPISCDCRVVFWRAVPAKERIQAGRFLGSFSRSELYWDVERAIWDQFAFCGVLGCAAALACRDRK